MKKAKKSSARPKEFVAAPFKALRGVQVEAAPLPAKVRAVGEQPVAAVDDDAVFQRAMADVRRLEPPATEKKRVREQPPAKKLAEDDQQFFRQAMESLQLDVDFRDELPDDVVPLRPLPVNRVRQLKRGALRIELELDLHGMTRDEALASLDRFISGAFKRGQQVVLVITGKGNNSPEEPVLQRAVAGWLREQGKVMVAEFAPAPRQLGGSGAFVVFLKTVNRGTGNREQGIGDRE